MKLRPLSLFVGFSALALESGLACTQPSQVPAVAPNTVPPGLHEMAEFVDAGGGALISTSILFAAFVADADQAQRQTAVESIGGAVIGGVRLDSRPRPRRTRGSP